MYAVAFPGGRVYLLEPDDVWMQQGAVVDELPLNILVNLQAAEEPVSDLIQRQVYITEPDPVTRCRQEQGFHKLGAP